MNLVTSENNEALEYAQKSLGVLEAPLLVREYHKLAPMQEQERLLVMKAVSRLRHEEVFDLLCETYRDAARSPSSLEEPESLETPETVATGVLFKKWGGPKHSKSCSDLVRDIDENELPGIVRRTVETTRVPKNTFTDSQH